MAISISEQYPGKTAGNTTAYPYGEARNVDAPGDGKGTPWEAAIVKDDQGFKQAILKAAKMIPSGQPDTAEKSQYLDALKKIMSALVPAPPEILNRAVARMDTNGKILSGKGISKIVKLSQGYYEVTLEKRAPHADYAVLLTASWGGRGGAASVNLDYSTNPTRDSFRFSCSFGGDNTAGNYDPARVNILVVY